MVLRLHVMVLRHQLLAHRLCNILADNLAHLLDDLAHLVTDHPRPVLFMWALFTHEQCREQYLGLGFPPFGRPPHIGAATPLVLLWFFLENILRSRLAARSV